MEVCVLTVFWLLTVVVLTVGYLLDKFPSLLPIMPSLLRWGKMRIGFVEGTKKELYLLPKRWYQHFYITGVFVNGTLLVLVYSKVFWGQPFPAVLRVLLKYLQYPVDHTGLTDAVPLLIVLAMHQIQVMRRCYETLFVNIFCERATMSVFIYGFGILFYAIFGLSVLTGMDFEQLTVRLPLRPADAAVYAAAFVVFMIASFVQNQSFRILAALRMNKKDNFEKEGYILPRGGLFDYVSCPHYLAEMIIYICFTAVFHFQHAVLLSVLFFVLANQLAASEITHAWYHRTFSNYPAHRKAVIPFVF